MCVLGTLAGRKSIEVGRTTKSRQDVCDLVRRMSEEYRGQSYNILMRYAQVMAHGLVPFATCLIVGTPNSAIKCDRNCNHFSKDFVHQLSGAKFPGWINRLANFGAVFPCAAALPESTMMPAPPPISASNRTDATRKEAKSKEARACAGKGLRK